MRADDQHKWSHKRESKRELVGRREQQLSGYGTVHPAVRQPLSHWFGSVVYEGPICPQRFAHWRNWGDPADGRSNRVERPFRFGTLGRAARSANQFPAREQPGRFLVFGLVRKGASEENGRATRPPVFHPSARGTRLISPRRS